MAEQKEKPKPRSGAAKSDTAVAKNRPARQPHTARNRFLVLLFLFVSVLAATAYLLMELAAMRGEVESLARGNAELAERESAQTATIESMRARLAAPPAPAPMDPVERNEIEQRLREETDSLRRQIGELGAAQRSLQTQPDFGWKVREAAYLLNLANRKLQLEADVAGAIVLLESADAALAQAERDDVLHIRQAIAGETARLRAVEPVDRDNIYFRLETLQREIGGVDLLAALRESVSAGNPPATPPESWLAAGLRFLGGVFVWRRWEERPAFELVAGQRDLIRESIRLRISQAQLALLRGEAGIYRSSLGAGLDQLQAFAGDETIARLAAEMNGLLAVNIAPELPMVNESLRLVGEFLAGEAQ